MQVLRAAQHPRMPWKNGGGETIEIARAPAGASLDTFDWRVSLAHVASDGPFSPFAGIDRTIAVVDGAGMILAIDGRDHLVTTTSAPLAFSGDVSTTARLVAGPTIDLNTMTRRGTWTHTVTRVAGPTTIGRLGRITLVVAWGDLTANGELLARYDVAIGETFTLAALTAPAYVIELGRPGGVGVRPP